MAWGEDWCTAANRDGADPWKQVWSALHDLADVKVVKVKAHLKFSHVLDGVIYCAQWSGIAIAEKRARAGRRLSSAASPCHAAHAQWTRAVAWKRWLVRMATGWEPDIAA